MFLALIDKLNDSTMLGLAYICNDIIIGSLYIIAGNSFGHVMCYLIVLDICATIIFLNFHCTREFVMPALINMKTYVKYCNIIGKKHINLGMFIMKDENDIDNFNKIKFHDGLECLTICFMTRSYSMPSYVNKIVFPNTVKELNILSRLNHFKNYTFNENIETIGYRNQPGSFEEYDTSVNLYVRNYVALKNSGKKIEKTHYGCLSLYHDEYYSSLYYRYFDPIERNENPSLLDLH